MARHGLKGVMSFCPLKVNVFLPNLELGAVSLALGGEALGVK